MYTRRVRLSVGVPIYTRFVLAATKGASGSPVESAAREGVVDEDDGESERAGRKTGTERKRKREGEKRREGQKEGGRLGTIVQSEVYGR